MPDRTITRVINRSIPKDGEFMSSEHDVDDDIRTISVFVHRNNLSELPADREIIFVRVWWSYDGGNTWIKGPGVGTVGGDIFYKGALRPQTSLSGFFPPGPGRKFRLTVTTKEAFLCRCDVDLLVASDHIETGPSIPASVAFLAAAAAATATDGTSVSTGAFDGSGTNRAVIAFAWGEDNAGSNAEKPSDVTWDVATPESLTELAGGIGVNDNTSAAVWGKGGQTSATDTLTANWTRTQNNMACHGASFTGVDQTTSFGNAQYTNSAPGNVSTITLTGVDADDFCYDGIAQYPSTDITIGADQTSRGNTTAGTSRHRSSTQDGADGGVMSWSGLTYTVSEGHVAAVINTVAAAAGLKIPVAMHSYRRRRVRVF